MLICEQTGTPNDVPPPQLISHISPGVNIHPGDLQLSGCHGHRLFMGRGAPANAKMHGLRQVFACAGYFHSNICMPSLVDVALRLCIRHLRMEFSFWSITFGPLFGVCVVYCRCTVTFINMRHKQKKLCRQYAQVMLRSPKRGHIIQQERRRNKYMKSQSSQYTCAHTDLDECICAKAGV